MFRSGRFAIVVAGLFSIAAPGFAQTQPAAPSDSARVLAGVREYPDAVVEAMVTLARHPDWLDKAAEQAKSKAGVNAGDPAAPDNIRQALRTLAPLPEAILLAAARRDELNILRDLRVEAPQGADVRLRQLRTDYATARREGALRWQQALQENKGALDAYRELLTRFSQKMREQIPNFAVVEVTDAAYYHVLPPDEILMGFGQQEKAPEQLWKVMTEWYDRFGADRVDEQALNASEPVSASRAENALIDGPAESRKGMFRAGDGKGSGAVGLIPVAIQPLADQPNEARLAYAIAEHERLWSAPADRQVAEPNAAAGMEAQDMAAVPVDDAEVLIEPPLEDGQVSDAVVTPARPDMIIPPAGLVRPADEPIVIASAYDDDVLFDGDANTVVVENDGIETVQVDPGITGVYDLSPTYYVPTAPSFGLSFGYSSYGRYYPWSPYWPVYYGYPAYPCANVYTYYPRFCNDRVYVRSHYDRGVGFGVHFGHDSDRRVYYSSHRDGIHVEGGRDRGGYVYRRDSERGGRITINTRDSRRDSGRDSGRTNFGSGSSRDGRRITIGGDNGMQIRRSGSSRSAMNSSNANTRRQSPDAGPRRSIVQQWRNPSTTRRSVETSPANRIGRTLENSRTNDLRSILQQRSTSSIRSRIERSTPNQPRIQRRSDNRKP